VPAIAERTWFKENLAEVEALEHPKAGKGYLFGETQPFERYRDLGINVRVLEPGQPASLYHSEAAEEFFTCSAGSASRSWRTRRCHFGSGTSCTAPHEPRT
jgi:uncharacterized cupin superfamily protein